MVSFFQRGGQFVRYETGDRGNGRYELLITGPDGTQTVESFATSQALDQRLRELEHDLSTAGWAGPFGIRF